MKLEFEPILKSKLYAFLRNYGYTESPIDTGFEYFVNHTICSSHDYTSLLNNNTLLDTICVGGGNDTGIDGIAIKINDRFVTDIATIDDIITISQKITVEFFFIQSKSKDKSKTMEYSAFLSGVKDFLKFQQNEPSNDKIQHLLSIKNYLFSDKIVCFLKDLPTIRTYFVSLGRDESTEHHDAKTKDFSEFLVSLNSYGDFFPHFLGNKQLRELHDETSNHFDCILPFSDSFTLPEANGVNDSMIISCYAEDIVNMMKSSQNALRKTIFNDNVRAYQGNTSVNEAIMETIKKSPENFMLVNNGVTIVSSDARIISRKITLSNPQVVNGCQTCSVLYEAFKQNIPIDKVTVVVKIIATNSGECSLNVIQGTNRQNIVYEEAFETTHQFHKNLEDFFIAQNNDATNIPIYYERRAKQYMGDKQITPIQKVPFRNLIRSFVSIFLKSPHEFSRHEGTLLRTYENNIFKENQSLYPYYVAPYLHVYIEKALIEGIIPRAYDKRKNHLLFVFSYMLANQLPPSIDKEKQITEYSNKILTNTKDAKKSVDSLKNSCEFLDIAIDCWVKEKGYNHRAGINDSKEFTTFLLKRLSSLNGEIGANNEEITHPNYFRGTVKIVKVDIRGFFYGYIRHLPDDIFVHQEQNALLDMSLIGKDVLYTINTNNKCTIIEVL